MRWRKNGSLVQGISSEHCLTASLESRLYIRMGCGGVITVSGSRGFPVSTVQQRMESRLYIRTGCGGVRIGRWFKAFPVSTVIGLIGVDLRCSESLLRCQDRKLVQGFQPSTFIRLIWVRTLSSGVLHFRIGRWKLSSASLVACLSYIVSVDFIDKLGGTNSQAIEHRLRLQ